MQKEIQKEMLNINGNLIGDVEIKTIQGKNGDVLTANFTLFRKMGKTGDEKTQLVKDFEKGDFIHVYGYYKEVQKADKTYKNFIVKHVNKIDKEMENKKEQEENEEE